MHTCLCVHRTLHNKAHPGVHFHTCSLCIPPQVLRRAACSPSLYTSPFCTGSWDPVFSPLPSFVSPCSPCRGLHICCQSPGEADLSSQVFPQPHSYLWAICMLTMGHEGRTATSPLPKPTRLGSMLPRVPCACSVLAHVGEQSNDGGSLVEFGS